MKARATLSFDANASAPVLPQAWDAYMEGMRAYAEPLAPHAAGRAAHAAWERAREEVAAAIGARPDEILFTSGGTEADAWALLGSLDAMASTPCGAVPHVVTSAIEHAAVKQTLALAVKRGLATVSIVAVPRSGVPSLGDILAHVTEQTRLVSWLAASNETGVVQPVAELAAACRARGVLLHTDAVQAVGRMPVDVRVWEVDLLAFSGHKLGAVGGVGILYRRAGTPLEPLLPGGGEVPNVPGAMSLAAALRALPSVAALQRLRSLRDGFEVTLRQALPTLEVLGEGVERLPNTSCLRFPRCQADGLLMALDIAGFAVSMGSACSSGSVEPSAILLGMGLSASEALETLRISFPRDVREDDVRALAGELVRLVRRSPILGSP